jgi:fumarate reductase subunit C
MAIREAMVEKLSLAPNPATDFITIGSAEKIKAVTVFDMSGKKVSVAVQGNSIDIRSLAAGAYIIDVVTDKERISSKFIKK